MAEKIEIIYKNKFYDEEITELMDTKFQERALAYSAEQEATIPDLYSTHYDGYIGFEEEVLEKDKKTGIAPIMKIYRKVFEPKEKLEGNWELVID